MEFHYHAFFFPDRVRGVNSLCLVFLPQGSKPRPNGVFEEPRLATEENPSSGKEALDVASDDPPDEALSCRRRTWDVL